MSKQKRVSYLSQLKFDPRLRNTWFAKYLSNVRLPILLILTIVIVGIYGFINIPRRLNPQINIPIVIVNTVLPGANPEDVESLVTIPLERALVSVEGVEEMTSTSQDSVSVVTLQFTSNVNPDEARTDAQAAVDTVSDLPEDAITPKVLKLDFENQPFWTFAVTVKNNDVASLMRFSDALKKKIENINKVDRVETSGLETQNIEVTIDLVKVHEFGIQPTQISQIVSTAARSFPAGIVNSTNSSFSLTINPDITSVDDIRNIRIDVDGQDATSLKLGDIVTVAYRSTSNQQGTYLASHSLSPARVVQFFVFKKESADIDAAFNDTKPVVDRAIREYDNSFHLFSVLNLSKEITDQFSDLFGEFRTTILLVFILLLVFLGLRQAIISSITVPLTFLASFAIINQLGLTLNFLTMFALLLSLGLLIDDTIVTVAAMTRYYRTGKFTPHEAGVMVWHDFIVPLWSTTITTIWAFVPLLIASGIIGEFIKTIPIVVTTTMLSSTTIAVLITMPLMIIFLKPQFPRRVRILFWVLGVILLVALLVLMLPKNAFLPVTIVVALTALAIFVKTRKKLYQNYQIQLKKNPRLGRVAAKLSHLVDEGLINVEGLSMRYRDVIERILSSKRARRRTLIAIIAFALVAYLLVPLGFVKNEFFPKEDSNLIYINVDLPSGANMGQLTTEAVRLLGELRLVEPVEYIVADIGQSLQNDGNRAPDPSSLLFTLNLPEEKQRTETSSDIAARIRKAYEGYTKGKLTVVELSGGPPAGADVQVNLVGEDFTVLDGYANQIAAFMEKQKGLANVDKSIKPGTSKIVFVPDKARMSEAQITPNDVGLWLRTYATGFTLESIRFGDREDDVVFRTSKYDEQDLNSLSSLEITNSRGASVPLLSLGHFKLETNPTSITRKNEKRTISVFASVIAGFTTTEKNAEVLAFVNKMDFQEGYGYETGGVNEENQKSVNSILQAMVLAFILILITMVIEFGSFRQAFMAMTIIPISTAGVFYIFALFHTPLSFASLIGVLALFGIVVTHAIVVIEKINDNRAHGLPLKDAISDAAANRLEPVLLTSMATIAGLLPITIADPFWRGLGGAIIAGLIFSGALKLFFIPVLYYNFYKGEEEVRRKR